MMKPLEMNAGVKAERLSGRRAPSLVSVANRRAPRMPWSAPSERRYGVRGRCPVCPPGQAGEGNGCGRWPPGQGLYLLDSEKSFQANGTEGTVGFADTGLRVGRGLKADQYRLSTRIRWLSTGCVSNVADSVLKCIFSVARNGNHETAKPPQPKAVRDHRKATRRASARRSRSAANLRIGLAAANYRRTL